MRVSKLYTPPFLKTGASRVCLLITFLFVAPVWADPTIEIEGDAEIVLLKQPGTKSFTAYVGEANSSGGSTFDPPSASCPCPPWEPRGEEYLFWDVSGDINFASGATRDEDTVEIDTSVAGTGELTITYSQDWKDQGTETAKTSVEDKVKVIINAGVIQIKRGDGEWEDLSGQSVIVGEKLAFKLILQDSSATPDAFEWSFDGTTFKSWGVEPVGSAIPSKGKKEKLESPDKSAQTAESVYFASGESAATVKCRIRVGEDWDPTQATLEVLRPDATVDAVPMSGGAAVDIRSWVSPHFPGNHKYLMFGDIAANKNGIKFTQSIEIPPGYSGDTQWVQLIIPHRRVHSPILDNWSKWTATDGKMGLDSAYPYSDDDPNAPASGDTPKQELTISGPGGQDITEINNESMEMYLMFKPTLPGAMWVPLKVVNWFWDGRAEYNYSSGNWVLTRDDWEDNPTATDTTEHPQWTKRYDTSNPSYVAE